MRKILATILVFTVILCGCTPKLTQERTLAKCFESTAQIEVDDMTYEASLSRLGDGWWIVELTAPEAVKGLVFTIDGEETEISFKGLHFTFDTSKFPVGSVVSAAVRSFDRLAPLTLNMIEGETNDFSSGEVDGMTYSLTMDKNGTPVSLDFGDNGMKITFLTFAETEDIHPEQDVIIQEQ